MAKPTELALGELIPVVVPGVTDKTVIYNVYLLPLSAVTSFPAKELVTKDFNAVQTFIKGYFRGAQQ